MYNNYSLSDDLIVWERYEHDRNVCCGKLKSADKELLQTLQVYSLENKPTDSTEMENTAARMLKNLDGLFNRIKAAGCSLHKLLEKFKKAESDAKVKHCFFVLESVHLR